MTVKEKCREVLVKLRYDYLAEVYRVIAHLDRRRLPFEARTLASVAFAEMTYAENEIWSDSSLMCLQSRSSFFSRVDITLKQDLSAGLWFRWFVGVTSPLRSLELEKALTTLERANASNEERNTILQTQIPTRFRLLESVISKAKSWIAELTEKDPGEASLLQSASALFEELGFAILSRLFPMIMEDRACVSDFKKIIQLFEDSLIINPAQLGLIHIIVKYGGSHALGYILSPELINQMDDACLSKRDIFGLSPLHHAILFGDDVAVGQIISLHEQLGNYDGNHCKVGSSHISLSWPRLSPTFPNGFQFTSFMLAMLTKNRKIINLFLNLNEGSTWWLPSIESWSLDRGPESRTGVGLPAEHHLGPVHVACIMGDYALVKDLLSKCKLDKHQIWGLIDVIVMMKDRR